MWLTLWALLDVQLLLLLLHTHLFTSIDVACIRCFGYAIDLYVVAAAAAGNLVFVGVLACCCFDFQASLLRVAGVRYVVGCCVDAACWKLLLLLLVFSAFSICLII
ncbi:unnamed protein product [Amaranthus hypochondriacus]